MLPMDMDMDDHSGYNSGLNWEEISSEAGNASSFNMDQMCDLNLDFTSEDLAAFDVEATIKQETDLFTAEATIKRESDLFISDQDKNLNMAGLEDSLTQMASSADFHEVMSKSSFPFLDVDADNDLTNLELGASAVDLLNPFEANAQNDIKLESGQNLLNEDCMWSSSLNFLDDLSRRKRSRDHSLTLSECTETLSKDINDIHCILGDVTKAAEFNEETEDDEEIDVVSDCDANSSSSSTISCSSTGSLNSSASGVQRYHQIQAGRSLLRKSNLPQYSYSSRFYHTPSQQTLIDHMNGDHCYFAMKQQDTQPNTSRKSTANPGMLTPNESSDDEVDCNRMTVLNPAFHGMNRNEMSTDEEEDLTEQMRTSKFRFKLNFQNKENQEQQDESHHHHYNQPTSSQSSSHQAAAAKGSRHNKRKSAIKNTHCPSQPSPKKAKLSATPNPTPNVRLQQQQKQISVVAPRAASRVQSNASNSEQKCREIRDLHNSMERQRRVDLRNNFEQLKDTVPELKDVEKASKLNILNKSSDYCKALLAAEARLLKEKEREMNRSNLLKKKLLQLSNEYQSVKTSSGRISVLNSSRHFSYY